MFQKLKVSFYIICLGYLSAFYVPYHTYDPRLDLYLKEYTSIRNEICKNDKIHFTIQTNLYFTDILEKDVLAQCLRGNRRWDIQFDRKQWYTLNEDARYQLVIHEMVHCDFNEKHSLDPNNFMYYSMNVMSKSIANKQLKEYLYSECSN